MNAQKGNVDTFTLSVAVNMLTYKFLTPAASRCWAEHEARQAGNFIFYLYLLGPDSGICSCWTHKYKEKEIV
jgi:hypothetical protein